MLRTTKNMKDKYEKIQQIRSNKPGYAEIYNIYAPPLMTGVIDGWIGYGTEPGKDENGNNTSYNKVREKLMKEAISKATYEWFYENKDKELAIKDGKIEVSQIISLAIAEAYLNKAKRILPTSNSVYSSRPEILDDRKLKKNLIQNVQSNISDELLDIKDENNNENKIIDIEFGNDTNISFDREEVKNVLNRLSVQILNWDSRFLDEVRNKVKELSPKYKIDEKSFCIDTSVVNRIKKQEKTANESKISLSDCIEKLKGLDPEKLSEAYKILEMLELGEINIQKMEGK